MRFVTSFIASLSLFALPVCAQAQTSQLPFVPSDIVSVYCIPTYDPPQVGIVLLDAQGYMISTVLYQALLDGGAPLPPNPCAA